MEEELEVTQETLVDEDGNMIPPDKGEEIKGGQPTTEVIKYFVKFPIKMIINKDGNILLDPDYLKSIEE